MSVALFEQVYVRGNNADDDPRKMRMSILPVRGNSRNLAGNEAGLRDDTTTYTARYPADQKISVNDYVIRATGQRLVVRSVMRGLTAREPNTATLADAGEVSL